MLAARMPTVSDAQNSKSPVGRARPSDRPPPPAPTPPSSGPGRTRRPEPLWRRLGRVFTAGDPILTLLVLAVVVYYRASRGIFQGKASGDGFFGFMMLPGVILHHTFDLGVPAPEWAAVIGRETTGLVANGCPIGPAILWTPTYLLGLGLDRLAAVPVLGTLLRLLVPTLHASPFTGRETADFYMAGLGSLAAGLFGVRLTFTLVARKLGVAAARFGVIGAVAATPLMFYLVTQPLYQHACAFFGVALLLERWDAWRGQMTLGRWAALGALGGVAMLMRQQEGLFFLLPAIDALAELAQAVRGLDGRRLGRTLLGGMLFLGCAILVYAPQLLLWRHYYGSLRPPQEPGHFIWWNPAVIEALFSTRAGLFPWVPVLYLAVPGLLLARRRLDGLVWRLGLVFALELWLNASVWDYHGSWAYGPRRYTDAAGIVALGLGGMYVTLGSGVLVAAPAVGAARADPGAGALGGVELGADGARAGSAGQVVGGRRLPGGDVGALGGGAAARGEVPRLRGLSVRAAGGLAVRAGVPDAGEPVRGAGGQLPGRARTGKCARCFLYLSILIIEFCEFSKKNISNRIQTRGISRNCVASPARLVFSSLSPPRFASNKIFPASPKNAPHPVSLTGSK